MPFDYFAACSLGLEEMLADELRELEAGSIELRRGGVAFQGDRALGYRANLWLRCAIRVQRLLIQGRAPHPDALYRLGSEVDWSRVLRVEQSLAVDSTVRDSQITHSQFASQKLKDAIVDQFRRRSRGARPNVDRKRPDVPIKLVIQRDVASIYLNLSGESLHKRGWRPVQVKSPLNESIAAGLLRHTGWARDTPLADPMCGSATFLIEAAHWALDRAPGLRRRFAFERLPDFDARSWAQLRRDAERRLRGTLSFDLLGADRHGGALAIARQSAERAEVAGLLRLSHCPVADYRPEVLPDLIVTNPPYGERIGEGDDLTESWRDLGQFLRRCPGATAWVLSGNPELPKFLGLKSSRRVPVKNGPLDCRFLRYEIRG
ncbi:MAG: RNA methyltransferase [Planctomycetes bacterium]|nr:RNA methyltransferase [Planctomycetota bacterium]